MLWLVERWKLGFAIVADGPPHTCAPCRPLIRELTTLSHPNLSADGSKYEGQFYYGRRHGQGVKTYANGNRCVPLALIDMVVGCDLANLARWVFVGYPHAAQLRGRLVQQPQSPGYFDLRQGRLLPGHL